MQMGTQMRKSVQGPGFYSVCLFLWPGVGFVCTAFSVLHELFSLGCAEYFFLLS